MSIIATKPAQHTLFEDAQGILIGTLLSALGMTFFKSTGLLMGGTAVFVFLGKYTTAFSFCGVSFSFIQLTPAAAYSLWIFVGAVSFNKKNI